MDKITQDMKYRQSLMLYADKHGVSAASRKYNKSQSFIYFWRKRYDGTIESLACHSRRPHGHPNAHTEEELALIRNMRRRNPRMGLNELWCRLRRRGYKRCLLSLYRVLPRQGLVNKGKVDSKYKPKLYEQMTYVGQRVQIDVKVVPSRCRVGQAPKLYQYTALDECCRVRCLGAYEEQCTFSSADFLCRIVAFYKRRGIRVQCVQTDNGFEFTNRFSNSKRDSSTLFELPQNNWGLSTSLLNRIRPGTTARWSEATGRTKNASMIPILSSPSLTSARSSLNTNPGPTISR